VTTRLVLASNNAKKLSELRALLAGLAVELLPQGELGIGEADEPHATFIENALAKARHAAQACGGAAIADDSGLCVDALGGQPGVVSAHFAPALLPAGADREGRRRVQDQANNRLLLQRCKTSAAAMRTSSVPWWPCVMRRIRSRWSPRVAGPARSCRRRVVNKDSATTR
jgi:non-canonical purine NTP pyrophosphatase (RdgB/HAM1 family)